MDIYYTVWPSKGDGLSKNYQEMHYGRLVQNYVNQVQLYTFCNIINIGPILTRQ